MKAKIICWMLVGLLLVGVVPTHAQEQEVVTATLTNGVTITYPDTWKRTQSEDGSQFGLVTENEVTAVDFYYASPADVATLQMVDPVAFLEYFYNDYRSEDDPPFDATQVQAVTVNEITLVYYESLDADGFMRLEGAQMLPSGAMVVFSAYPVQAAEIPAEDKQAIFEIASTASYGTYYFADGSSIQIPADWEASLDANQYIQFLNETAGARVAFYAPELLAELGATSENLVPVIQDAFRFTIDKSLTFDPNGVTPLQIGTFAGARYPFVDTLNEASYQRIFFAVPLPEGWVMLFDTAPNFDAVMLPEDEAALIQIMASFAPPAE